jgi:hypothetical protein
MMTNKPGARDPLISAQGTELGLGGDSVMTPRRTTALQAQESPPAVGELARNNRARVM